MFRWLRQTPHDLATDYICSINLSIGYTWRVRTRGNTSSNSLAMLSGYLITSAGSRHSRRRSRTRPAVSLMPAGIPSGFKSSVESSLTSVPTLQSGGVQLNKAPCLPFSF